MRKYNINIITVSSSQALEVGQNVNGITFINTGTTVVTVNGIPLNPGTPGVNNGDSVSWGGNQDEIFEGRVDINFVTGAGQLQAIVKYYLL